MADKFFFASELRELREALLRMATETENEGKLRESMLTLVDLLAQANGWELWVRGSRDA